MLFDCCSLMLYPQCLLPLLCVMTVVTRGRDSCAGRCGHQLGGPEHLHDWDTWGGHIGTYSQIVSGADHQLVGQRACPGVPSLCRPLLPLSFRRNCV